MPSSAPPPFEPPSQPAEAAVRAHFRAQAASCRKMGSPFNAALLEAAAKGLSTDIPVGKRLLEWRNDPKDDALALRFAGGLHWLALSGADAELAEVYRSGCLSDQPPQGARLDWTIFERVMERHSDSLMNFLAGPPQTNEVGRSAVLYGGFAVVARRFGLPLRLREIGASAGLNLNWQRYGYRPLGITAAWGALDSAVILRPNWDGPTPEAVEISVGDGRGCDLNPADISKITVPEDPVDTWSGEASRLLSYIWPDQEARLERMRDALRIAGSYPPVVERSGAASWLDKVLSEPAASCTRVVYHTIVWQYLSSQERRGIEAAIARAADTAGSGNPLAWLRMEPSANGGRAELRLTCWPGGQDHHLADADYHGAWIRWFGSETA